jgi:hypothetical protein
MMREIYVNENINSIRDIPLSTTSGIKLIAVCKQRKRTWYAVKPWIEKNVIETLTQRQFHEALQNGKR